MNNDTMISFADPAFRDKLSALVRAGARRSIAQAVEASVEACSEAHDW